MAIARSIQQHVPSSDLFSRMMDDEFEQVVFCHDRTSGLRAIIAIHNTTIGPALGGIRMRPYPTEQDALVDVLRLARAMTFKAALAGLVGSSAARAASRFGARIVPPDDVYAAECDIFSPNALGAGLNDETIPRLRCKLVCGGANKQLAEDRHGEVLHTSGILFAPD